MNYTRKLVEGTLEVDDVEIEVCINTFNFACALSSIQHVHRLLCCITSL